jgi:hypothetical protein
LIELREILHQYRNNHGDGLALGEGLSAVVDHRYDVSEVKIPYQRYGNKSLDY